MNEISFYPDICEKFSKYLAFYLPKESKIYYSYNKILPQMVDEIEKQMDEKSDISNSYIPRLKLDILFGIKVSNKPIRFILIEVKYCPQLTLADYSQLMGYLQVARKIDIGILFLVRKQASSNPLSNDFSNILQMKNLPMKWEMKLDNNSLYNFQSGINYYVPNSEIEWIPSDELCGIGSFPTLSQKICSDDL
ncbi:MAG: hypothetical protein LBU84_18850 [Prevotella sp.]|jgi:hypothetical protein|nr:hypothetical protein [Prevotella sp.]